MSATTYTVFTSQGTKVLETHSYRAASERASYLARQHGGASLEADGEPLSQPVMEYLDRICAGSAVGEYRNPTREEIEDAQHFAVMGHLQHSRAPLACQCDIPGIVQCDQHGPTE